jgi:hypothetical protein
MSRDPGAGDLRALLETPSLPLERAIAALGTSLESAEGAVSGGLELPESANPPIAQLRAYYSELRRRIAAVETSNPGRRGAIKALRRMDAGLAALAAAVGVEGEEAQQEAALGAVEMERAGTELKRAVERLG